MNSLEHTCASLRAQIAETEAQLARLKQELYSAEQNDTSAANGEAGSESDGRRDLPLLTDEYRRYGRQMIVPQLGLQGQLRLRSSKVLLVGAGGLGCPAALYLAGAGVGTLGIIDGDSVESSNLHRQVLHRTRNVGKHKVDSAIDYLRELNPHPTYIAYRSHLTPQDAHDIFKDYDVVLDCTDNPATRYLISDTAVTLGKPLVSASALRTEGQLMVLNNPPLPPGDNRGGPCYRCVFPKPPPADSVTSCADGGILGPVVGTMGVLQALEAIKVITSSADGLGPKHSPYLHIFSAYSVPPFRSVRLRSRRSSCAACSASPSVTLDSIKSGLIDYIFFCGATSPLSLLSPNERVSPRQYREMYPVTASGSSFEMRPPILIDVREKTQFDICSIRSSINIPISTIIASKRMVRDVSASDDLTRNLPPWLPPEITLPESRDPIYVVCRLGNDSQVAVQRLKDLGLDYGGERFIGDIQGGLRAWREQVDPELPEY